MVVYCSGVISARVFKMPNLVGEIVSGIILGPPLLEFVPNPEAWVMLGEIGLIILVIEAGIDIDLSTLKLIGTRGVMIATIGSILPIGLGMLIAWMIQVEGGATAIIAAGATFGPTSLGIALNILRGGGILNTPVGQLIISAAVIDDMIALIVLSQLESLKGEIDAASVLIPVISALLYLLVGGYVAIFMIPPFLDHYVFNHLGTEHKDKIELCEYNDTLVCATETKGKSVPHLLFIVLAPQRLCLPCSWL
jgi:Kef-type K+ transport system membrane component KefB